MKDALGNTIYVGKAKDLHRRLGNYFSPTGATLSNHKTRALINAIASFDYFETRNDQEAFLLESKIPICSGLCMPATCLRLIFLKY